VLCEELCKHRVPFALVDVEGEYPGLKEKYEVVWVGDDQTCDLEWDAVDIKELARHAPDLPPLLVDVSEAVDPRSTVAAVLGGIYQEVAARRTPYLLIVEEADRFVPQAGERLPILGEVARRGRKRGLGLLLATQRPSLVDKNVLSQCTNQLIGRLLIQNDLQAVAQFFPGHGLPKQLTGLAPGMFYALGGLSPLPTDVEIRARETPHGGFTPKLAHRLLRPASEILAKLRHAPAEAVGAQAGPLGLAPLVTPEAVPALVKRAKRFVLFGEGEAVGAVHLIWRSLVEIGVHAKRGLVKKRFATRYFTLDGVTGRGVDLHDRLELRAGLERLLGLKAEHLELLRTVPSDHDESVTDVASRIGMSTDVARKLIRALEEARLVRSSMVGRVKTLHRLVEVPDIPLSATALALESLGKLEGSAAESRLTQAQVEELVKGLWTDADLESFRPFVYPLYRVELARKGRRRTAWIDGRTGQSVHL
jgi:hypothetical protein